MKKLTILSSALLIAGVWQAAQAQPPGGGGFGAGMTFDAINQADADGNKDDYLTVEELRAFMEERQAAGGGGGGRFGGGGQGGGDFVATMFARWDTQPEGGDGRITREEFDNRPRGRGGPGGGPPQ